MGPGGELRKRLQYLGGEVRERSEDNPRGQIGGDVRRNAGDEQGDVLQLGQDRDAPKRFGVRVQRVPDPLADLLCSAMAAEPLGGQAQAGLPGFGEVLQQLQAPGPAELVPAQDAVAHSVEVRRHRCLRLHHMGGGGGVETDCPRVHVQGAVLEDVDVDEGQALRVGELVQLGDTHACAPFWRPIRAPVGERASHYGRLMGACRVG